MKQLSKLTVGDLDFPVECEAFSDELNQKIRFAKEDSKHFGWKLKHFCVTRIDGEIWLVGYTKKDFAV